MKRWIASFLFLVLMLPLGGCAGLEEETAETEPSSATGETNSSPSQEMAEPILFPSVTFSQESENYTKLKKLLTWEDVMALPQKRSDMTEEEMRTLCIEFFRFAKTAVWIPDDSVYFRKNKAVDVPEVIDAGKIYGGLPYVSTGSGNIYRLFDYMNPETGVVDLSAAVDIPAVQANTSVVADSMKLFGNQCSVGAYWAWGRVINSANYDWTNNMVQSKGFIRVGPYTYQPFGENLSSFTSTNTTKKVVEANGQQVMFESYALLKPADGLVYYLSGGGHTLMCSSEPVIVRNPDGTINGDMSYIKIIDQTSAGTWHAATNDAGDSYWRKNSVDVKKNFTSLYKGSYLPFTFKEFLGQDPVEETECSFNFHGKTITPKVLAASFVKANYGISDVYAILRDGEGNVIRIDVSRASKANVKTMMLSSSVKESEWMPLAGKGYTVEIVAQLSTGERPVLYRGELVSAST